MLKRGFLNEQERADRLRVGKNCREEHRVSRRAIAILLLDQGMSFEQVANVLFMDDSTIRVWRDAYEETGIESIYAFNFKGGAACS